LPALTTVAQLIRERIEDMTRGERRAARALLANYPLLGLRTVAEFAVTAGVSSPTVLRFVARLGFDSYSDLQDQLHEELTDQLKPPLEKALPPDGSNPNGILGEVGRAICSNVEATLQAVTAAELTGAVDLITPPSRPVYLAGGRFTDALAGYMATHLALMRPGVTHVGRAGDTRRDLLVDLPKNATVVLFDIRRYDSDLLPFARAVTERSAKIVLITDQWLSPVAQHATNVLAARIEVPSIWDSNAALMAIVEMILAGAARQGWPRTERRLQELEALRRGPEDR
jgi:DNA-binding MurR/RpiR family transcriptional regulator